MSGFINNARKDWLDGAERLASFGATSLAYRVEVNGRQQFVKCLRPEFQANPVYVALFSKEFVVGKRLSHPNLVTYNEMQTGEKGLMMLLDYVAGETLTQRLLRQPDYFLKSDNLLRFSTQLLSCMEYLHSHQVVHLDLKPDNIMLTQVGGDVKVLDLGFCYSDTYSTTIGRTDNYAAPEQLEEGLGGVDARTDIYAFGRILQEIEKAQRTSLPRPFKTLMNRCLSRRKEDRPMHASDCIRMTRRRHTLRWTLLSLLLLALTGFFGWYFGGGPERWREKMQLRTPEGRPYDFIYHTIYYRILSRDSLTCEAVGWTHQKSDIDPNIMLYEVALNDSRRYQVIGVGDSAFAELQEIRSIYLPAGLRYIGNASFWTCTGISDINIPNTVTEIGGDAFGICHGVSGLHISSSVRQLRNNTFASCQTLEYVQVPEGVESIGLDCFANCLSLSHVTLPATLRNMDRGVFFNCPRLQHITLPASLRSIGDYAFYKCDALTDVQCLAPEPPAIGQTFSRSDIRVHVPRSSVEKYRSHKDWGQYEITAIE